MTEPHPRIPRAGERRGEDIPLNGRSGQICAVLLAAGLGALGSVFAGQGRAGWREAVPSAGVCGRRPQT